MLSQLCYHACLCCIVVELSYMNQIIQTAIIDRNIKVGHDEHFFIFVYCHERQTINHRLIGMNFYISLHLLVT